MMALPAKFFRIEVDAGPNSMGEEQPGFSLQTGSGTKMQRLAHDIARAASEGMIGLEGEEKETMHYGPADMARLGGDPTE